MKKFIRSVYVPADDGSGTITEYFDDGTERSVRLPPPFVFDLGPCRNTAEDEAAIQAAASREDR